MNRVVLIGRPTKAPELSYTQSQKAVCKFILAVNRPKKNGEQQNADFIRIVVWGKTAEVCDKYLYKGKQVAIEGRISTGSYQDKDGKTVYTTDVIADNVEFLGDRQESRSNDDEIGFTATDEEVPF